MSTADLKELRQQFADDTAEWEAIRKEASKDMRYVAGDPWDPADRRVREDAGRPCLSLDELSQYTNQVVNEVRANKRAVKFAPVGDGANDDTAEFYADKMREIEYRARAQVGYTTAFENAVQRSYGFVRVNTRYETPRSTNQDLWIDPVHNPDLITPDPYALMPDLSDMKHCWVRESWDIDAFNRKWPKHKIQGRAHHDLMRDAATWVTDTRVWVSEQWKVKTTPRTLLIVQPMAPASPGAVLGLQQAPQPDPIAVFADEKRPAGKVLASRKVDDPSVYQCITNGVDTLEENPWLGKYIPIVACLGKVIYLDEGGGSKRKILSLIRLARDPYMLYCYYRTQQAEMAKMIPKAPVMAYKGQFKGVEQNWQKASDEPIAFLEALAITEATGAQILPLPTRLEYHAGEHLQALELAAEGARRAIQAAIGHSPLPTMAQRKNEKSGVALKHIDENSQRGSYHFTDHYLDMITHVGVIVEDLMDKIYDTAREVGIRKANDTAEVIRINDGSPKAVNTHGHHLVTVSTGQSFDSEREAASDFADTLSGISPEIFTLLGPLIVKLKNLGPIGDEMIELLETIQPPPVQALREAKKQGDPAQAQQQLVQAKAQLQQLQQVLQQMQQALETEQAKQQATIQKATIDAQASFAIAKLREETALAIAKLQALVKPEQEAEAEAIEAELQRQFELAKAEMEHEHAMELERMKAEHAAQQAERQHDHALESGTQQIDGKIEVEKAKPKPQPKAKADA